MHDIFGAAAAKELGKFKMVSKHFTHLLSLSGRHDRYVWLNEEMKFLSGTILLVRTWWAQKWISRTLHDMQAAVRQLLLLSTS